MELTTALICDKWQLPIIEGTGGFFGHTKLGELGRRARCFEWLMSGVPQGKSVIEYFGGIGIQSAIIRNLLRPSRHTIYEIDDDCLRQLDKAFPGVIVEYGDAFEELGRIYSDIAILDFPDMTAKRYPKWDDALARLFSAKPELVEITDVGNRYLHIHKNLYSQILGTKIQNIEDYVKGLSKFFYQTYEYSVKRAAYKSTSTYMLLSRNRPETIEFRRFEGREGFRHI